MAIPFDAMAAVFNLNHHATFLHFHIGSNASPFFVFDMSLSNVLVIVAMLAVFAIAIALPFPRPKPSGSHQ